MPTPIVLKDSTNADVTFNYSGSDNAGMHFDQANGTLMSRRRISISQGESKNTNRVRVKLSLPTVCEGSEACAVPSILYTQVASADITVVKFASLIDRKDLAALFGNLILSAAVKTTVTDGIMPQ